MEALRPTHYLAVITTGSRQNATEMLDHFHCTDWFDLILTQEDVVNNKPDPEGYLKAMAHFGVDAAHTMIFEDSAPALPPPAPPEPACLRAISSDLNPYKPKHPAAPAFEPDGGVLLIESNGAGGKSLLVLFHKAAHGIGNGVGGQAVIAQNLPCGAGMAKFILHTNGGARAWGPSRSADCKQPRPGRQSRCALLP